MSSSIRFPHALIVAACLVAMLVLFAIDIGSSIAQKSRVSDQDGRAYLPLVVSDKQPSTHMTGYTPDVVIVKLSEETGIQSADQRSIFDWEDIEGARPLFMEAGIHAESTDTFGLDRIYRVDLREGTDIENAIFLLEAKPGVAYAEPDYLANPIAAPNDPRYAEQWSLSNIAVAGAWDVTTGDATTILAIVDSGVDLTHPDLSPQLWSNPGEVAGNSIDDDANGYNDDVHGWNFVSNNANVADDNGHGTLVSGIAAAATNNNEGISGICRNCKIMPVKVMQASGIANYSDIAAGIHYAVNKGARVVNLSLGGYADSQLLRDVVEVAAAQDVVLVGGVGNGNVDTPFYPAAYDDVLAVASVGEDDVKSFTTNFGDRVDVSAPGEDILSTALGGSYTTSSGTSIAAPFSAGVAGLVISENPAWSASLVRQQIIQTSDNVNTKNPGYGGKLGSGRINATQAMGEPEPDLVLSDYIVGGVADGRPDSDATAEIYVNVRNEWDDATSVNGVLSTSDGAVTVLQSSRSFGNIASMQTAANGSAFEVQIGPVGYNHAIPFKLRLTADGGHVKNINFTVTTRGSVENVQGTIGSNTTWTSDKTYLVKGNIGIAAGVTLNIEPGTHVQFDGNYALNVGGTLIADGTEAAPIVFEGINGKTWDRIRFDDPSTDAVTDSNGQYVGGNLVRNVKVRGAIGGISCSSSTPYIYGTELYRGGVNCSTGATELIISDSLIVDGVTTGGPSSFRLLNSTVTNEQVKASSGFVISNTITGPGIELTSGKILSNTVRNGSIYVAENGEIEGNRVLYTTGNRPGIFAGRNTAVRGNAVIGAAGYCVTADRGAVERNLIANCDTGGIYLRGDSYSSLAPAAVISNTLTGIQGYAINLEAVPDRIAANNFVHNPGKYDIYCNTAFGTAINASNNWWGTTDSNKIAARVFDFNDDYNKGEITVDPVLSGASESAPAFVTEVTVSPDTTIGIETVHFNAKLSGEINMDTIELAIVPANRGTWTQYTPQNSSLISPDVRAIGQGADNAMWFGGYAGVHSLDENGAWTGLLGGSFHSVFRTDDNSMLFGQHNSVVQISEDGNIDTLSDEDIYIDSEISSIAHGPDGAIWLGTSNLGYGAIRIDEDGKWEKFTKQDGLISNDILAIAMSSDESLWFATDAGVSRYGKYGTWTTYAGGGYLNGKYVTDIDSSPDGTIWFAAIEGLYKLDTEGTWTKYPSVSGAFALEVTDEGSVWYGGTLIQPNGEVKSYSVANGLAGNEIHDIFQANDRSVWFASAQNNAQGGASQYWMGDTIQITLEQDPNNPLQYHGQRKFTSATPPGEYYVTVFDVGTEGTVYAAPFRGLSVLVSYANPIAIQKTPHSPNITAMNDNLDGTTLTAAWTVEDPDSVISKFRYRIGTREGAGDIVDWTTTSGQRFTRRNLKLVHGQTYYVTIQAGNDGGLWSANGVSNAVIAGVGPGSLVRPVYLPALYR